ncbi:MAG: acyloxyacyl hydrolase [Chitinophagales bacterium]
MKKILIFIFCFSTASNIFCQGKKNLPKSGYKWSFEVNGFASKILKHTKRFQPEIPALTYGFELNASYKTFGNKNWHRAFNYPEIGVSYIQTHFGNEATLGSAYGFAPFVKYYITRSKVVDFHAKLAGGLAYLTQVYDPIKNPINNVIGSRLNTVVQFRMGVDFHLTKEVDLQFGATFMHYSNSSVQAPNLGINIPSGNLGVIYKPKYFEREYIVEQDKTIFQKKNEYTFKFGLGVNQKFARGANYPAYSFALQYGRYFGYANKLLAGAIVSFEQYEYDFLVNRQIDEDKDQTFRAMDWSAYLGYEMMLGRVGLSFIVGAYIHNPTLGNAPIWAKPGITYYFPGFGKQKHKPFLGINMKTHYFTAQYVEMNFGIAF